MTIAQYFNKSKVDMPRNFRARSNSYFWGCEKKRINVHGLRPEYQGFVADVQGWQTQPSLVDFENLLVGQEAIAKRIVGVSLKGEEEALYTNKSKGTSKRHTGNGSKKDGDKVTNHHGNGGSRPWGASKNHGNTRKFDGEC